jgi:hypothetical protein
VSPAPIQKISITQFVRASLGMAMGFTCVRAINAVSAQGQEGARISSTSSLPKPTQDKQAPPRGDLFDKLTEAPGGLNEHSVLARLAMPADAAARLVPIVMDALRSPERFWPNGRNEAAPASAPVEHQSVLLDFLWELGPRSAASGPELAALMNSSSADPGIRIKAAGTLVRVTGLQELGLPFLLGSVQKGDVPAVDEIGKLGPQGDAAGTALADIVSSSERDAEIKAHAASALVRVTGKSEPGLSYLLGLLRVPMSGDAAATTEGSAGSNRYLALGELVKLGPMAKDAEPTMTGLMNSGRVPLSLRIATASALVSMEGKSDPGLIVLCALLTDATTDAQSQSDIVAALEDLGPLGADAVPTLVHLVERRPPDDSLKGSIASALSAILTPSTISKLAHADYVDDAVQLIQSANGDVGPFVQLQLARLQGNPDSFEKASVAEHLAGLGTDATPQVSSLSRLLEDDKAGPRIAAAAGLIRITGNAEPGVTSLIKELHDASNGVVCSAIDALGDAGAKAAGAVPALTQLVEEGKADPGIRACAARALVLITDSGESGVPVLSALIGDANAGAGLGTVEMLGDLGPKAAGSISTLTALLNSGKSGPRTKLRAASALISIDESPLDAVTPLMNLLANEQLEASQRELASQQAEVAGLRHWLDDMQNATADEYLAGLAAVGFSVSKISTLNSDLTELNKKGTALRSQGVDEGDARIQSLLSEQASTAKDLQEAIDMSRKSFEMRYKMESFQAALLAKAAESSGQDRSIQISAARLLGDIGPKAAEAIPALEAMIGKPGVDPIIRIHAASALARIAGKPGVDALVSFITNSGWVAGKITDPDSVRVAVEELGDFATSDWARPDLVNLAGSDTVTDGRLKAVVVAARFRTTENPYDMMSEKLDRMLSRNHLLSHKVPRVDKSGSGPEDVEQTRKECIDTLVGLLQKKREKGTVATAAEALGGLGVHAVDAVPGLVDLLESQDLGLHAQMSAAAALVRITGLSYPGVQYLSKNLRGPQSLEYIAALGDLGSAAVAAVPSLLAMRDTATDMETLRAIDFSLAKIRNTSGL